MKNKKYQKELLIELKGVLNKLREEVKQDPNFEDILHELEILDTDNLRNKKDKIDLALIKYKE